MSGRGNPDNLRRAARAKHEAATHRADEALRRLAKRDAMVSFSVVAAEAGVSKDFLYRSSDLRDRIEHLRSNHQRRRRTAPSSDESTVPDTSSVVRTLTLELKELRRRHRDELAELNAALAAAHGELLQLKRVHGISD